jgi:hypothetical protein
MVRKWVLILVGLVTLLGCSEDDDTANNGNRIQFSVSENYIVFDDNCWIIVSDDAGNVLDVAQLQRKGTYAFTLPSDLEGGAVAVTLVHNRFNPGILDEETSIVTYTNVQAGKYTLGLDHRGENGDFLKDAWVTVQGDFKLDDPQLDWMAADAMLGAGYASGDIGLRFQILPINQKSALLMIKKEQPYRYLYVEVETGQQYERAEADFKTGTTHVLGTPIRTVTSLMLTGRNGLGDFQYYAPYEPIIVGDRTIDVPIMPGIFDTHTLEFTGFDDDGKVYTTRSTFGQIPPPLTVLDGSIESVVPEGNFIHWEANGTQKPDGIHFYISKENYYSKVAWLVVGEADKQQITLPLIPKIVPLSAQSVTIEGRSFTAWAHAWGLQATLVDYPEFTGYQDYLVKYHLRKTEYGEPDFWKVMQEWK